MRRLLFSFLFFIASAAPLHAADSYTVNNGSYSTITEHSTCKRVTNNHASGQKIFVPTKTNAEWQSFYNNPPPGVTAAACSACNLPWGGTTGHGTSMTAYQASSVACGNSCVSESRSCSDGTLSGSYQYSSCSVGSCASCNLPWGGSISHGQSVTAYAASSVPCGSSCSSQTRTCNNGSLSGSYQYSSCSVGSCCSPSGTSCNPFSHNCCSGTCVMAMVGNYCQ